MQLKVGHEKLETVHILAQRRSHQSWRPVMMIKRSFVYSKTVILGNKAFRLSAIGEMSIANMETWRGTEGSRM